MLTKIIAVKNVGRFINSAAPGNPELCRNTYICGANGFGKTTLCAVLRSLQTGDPGHVLGRHTLGAVEPPTVEFLTPAGVVKFDGESWSERIEQIAIFDGVFIADNVHSGEVVDIGHKRNLYRVIVGEDGVRLADEDARLAAESRAKTGEITAAAKALQAHIPAGMTILDFIGLPADDEIDARIEDQFRQVAAAREAEQIQNRPTLVEFDLPALTADFAAVLATTVDGVAEDAELHLADHLQRHCFAEDGTAWLATGLDWADDDCPFCGQDIRGLPLIAAYRDIFSDRYRALTEKISSAREAIERQLGDAFLARLEATAANNRARREFWERFCAFDAVSCELPAGLAGKAGKLRSAAIELLERKLAAPLSPVAIDEAYTNAIREFEDEMAQLKSANGAIRAANAIISAKKEETGAADLRAAESKLGYLRTVRLRHTVAVAKLCEEHAALCAAKALIDRDKDEVRARLNEHTEAVVEPYERRINELLTAFNAGFVIAKTAHAYPGGLATSTYQIVINETPVDLGDVKTPTDRPSFKNTLSGGDRATLALAFFLASLERDPTRADKIVVFDDPFSSQDAFRRRQTLHEISRMSHACAQTFVLSHDATFLKQLWDKAPADSRIALAISDHRALGSKIAPTDLEAACRGRTATDMDDLQTHVTTGAGNLLDIIRKMRTVLETYCRTTFVGYFEAHDALGTIVRKIRDGGEAHPASALYDELDQINDYTAQYHHGEDLADTSPDKIDPVELCGFVRRTLKVANALQA
jgi:wobble nucleotide-excising tRNase